MCCFCHEQQPINATRRIYKLWNKSLCWFFFLMFHMAKLTDCKQQQQQKRLPTSFNHLIVYVCVRPSGGLCTIWQSATKYTFNVLRLYKCTRTIMIALTTAYHSIVALCKWIWDTVCNKTKYISNKSCIQVWSCWTKVMEYSKRLTFSYCQDSTNASFLFSLSVCLFFLIWTNFFSSDAFLSITICNHWIHIVW